MILVPTEAQRPSERDGKVISSLEQLASRQEKSAPEEHEVTYQ